jgi:hypothetical protein
MSWSEFCRYLVSNRQDFPPKLFAELRGEALKRRNACLTAGRAERPVDFSDLATRAEAALGAL